MYKIICPFCGAENRFPTKDYPPEDCLNKACQHYLGGLDIITIYEERKDDIDEQQLKKNEKIVGLKLIYQKTS